MATEQTPTTSTSAPGLAPHLWRSALLGEPRALELSAGRLEVFERGDGPPIVLTHGWFANANLWRGVVDRLADRFTCLTLDLPFGSHRVPMDADADLSPEACGALVAEAIEALDRGPVTLVGADSGGAYSQIAVARRPDLVDRLVLNACETLYDEFPPPPFDGLPQLAEDPDAIERLFAMVREPEVLYSPVAYGLLVSQAMDERVSNSYVLPCLEDDRLLNDTRKVMRTASAVPVHAAARELIASFHRPVLFAWGGDDRVFPLEHARRYAEQLADARVEVIPDARSFTAEDQPEALAAAIARFAG